jgi:hypothetical protein
MSWGLHRKTKVQMQKTEKTILDRPPLSRARGAIDFFAPIGCIATRIDWVIDLSQSRTRNLQKYFSRYRCTTSK